MWVNKKDTSIYIWIEDVNKKFIIERILSVKTFSS